MMLRQWKAPSKDPGLAQRLPTSRMNAMLIPSLAFAQPVYAARAQHAESRRNGYSHRNVVSDALLGARREQAAGHLRARASRADFCEFRASGGGRPCAGFGCTVDDLVSQRALIRFSWCIYSGASKSLVYL